MQPGSKGQLPTDLWKTMAALGTRLSSVLKLFSSSKKRSIKWHWPISLLIIIMIMTTYFSISEQLPVHFRRKGNTGVCLFFFSWEKVCVFFFLLMTKMSSLFQRSSRVFLGQFQ